MSKTDTLIEKNLTEYNTKPLLPLELPIIKRKLNNPSTSIESFKIENQRDPIFCWYQIEAAWQATQKRATHPFAADHAMSLIGIGGAQRLFAKLGNNEQPQLSQEVIFHLSCSLLAAELAKQLGQLSTGRPQTYWTALFYQFPDTLLWYLHPKSMWRIYYRQLTLPKKITLFEEAKLGFNRAQWRLAVAEKFHLGEQLNLLFHKQLPATPSELFSYAKHGYDEEQTKSLKEWHKNESWLIRLANQLAQAIIIPWHKQSIRHIHAMLKHSLNADGKKINQVIYRSVEKVSHHFTGSQLMNPAVGLTMLDSKPQFPQWLVKPAIDTTKIIKAKKIRQASNKLPEKKANKLSQLINKLTTRHSEFASSAALLHEGLTAIISELKFSRVSFLAIDHQKKSARTRIALNAEKSKKIRPDFNFVQPTPLEKFIGKQMFMRISREKHQNIWRQLPQAIQKAKVEQFILCSLKPGNHVKAIIYIDASNPLCFEEKRLTKVKMLLQAINKGLIYRNTKK